MTGEAKPTAVPDSDVIELAQRRLQRDDRAGEDDLAIEFILRYGGSYRSVPGWGWMRLEGTRWMRDVRLRHFDDARFICRMVSSPRLRSRC